MESLLYSIYSRVVFVSKILLVRFLIRQQLVRKYRKPSLSMKRSLFMMEMSYVFLFTFFSLPLISIFGRLHFSFSQCHHKFFILSFQQRMSSLFFISRSSSLSLFFSLSFAGLSPVRTFSFSLSFYFSVFQIVDMTIILI